MPKIYRHTFSLICLLILLSGFSAQAQSSSVRATIEPSEIVIGQHAVINLEVIAPKGRKILFPIYPDTLITGIEVLGMLPPDTLIAHEVMTINQKYVVTSFDSTLYHIPYMTVLDAGDTIISNDFGLKVSSIALPEQVLSYLDQLSKHETDSIDFEKLQLADIKQNLKAPFRLSDYLSFMWMLLGLGLFLLILGVIVFLLLRKKRKGHYFTPKEVILPHALALKALDQMKSEKIWQQGLEKQYYTQLTDILRKYIEDRFHVNAFERTSDEILKAINTSGEADSAVESLAQILNLSDLVKFAKYTPLTHENELSILNAYLFVNQTKQEPVAEIATSEESSKGNLE